MLVVDDNLSPLTASVPLDALPLVETFLANEKAIVVHQRLTANWIANGFTNRPAELEVVSESWYRVRVAIGGFQGGTNQLALVSNTANACTMHAVAFDGVYRSSIPGAASTSFTLTDASRIDLALQCTAAASISYAGTTVVDINVVDGTAIPASPFANGEEWSPARPTFLAYVLPQIDFT